MNQIINEISNSEYKEKKSKNKRKILIVKIIFFISIFILIFFIIFLIFFIKNLDKKENNSKILYNNFNLSSLYSNNENYSVNFLNQNGNISNNVINSFVIGIIEIDKLKINYPILSETSKELLQISPCRFAGPMPNEIGNLCIAGHNYIDNRFFARISTLELNDIITIYNLYGVKSNYIVLNKKEVQSSDISCTNQDTNGKKIVTLMTCNSILQTRIIITCIESNI